MTTILRMTKTAQIALRLLASYLLIDECIHAFQPSGCSNVRISSALFGNSGVKRNENFEKLVGGTSVFIFFLLDCLPLAMMNQMIFVTTTESYCWYSTILTCGWNEICCLPTEPLYCYHAWWLPVEVMFVLFVFCVSFVQSFVCISCLLIACVFLVHISFGFCPCICM